jgi:uncharacterized membrane protein SpoIIM required for sporulation
MIIDLKKFIRSEQPYWDELKNFQDRLDLNRSLNLEEIQRFHYLYERVSSALVKIQAFASEPNLTQSLESLVARAYTEIHEVRNKKSGFNLLKWWLTDFPQTFRKTFRYFLFSLLLTLVGVTFGGLAVRFDPHAKTALIPFANLAQDPRERVKEEESGENAKHFAHHKTPFSAVLMQNNIKVAISCVAFGMTYAIGTIAALFINGVTLGVVAIDYIQAGQTEFLLGWLMPHGVIEIPAILIAGQAGLLLGRTLIGWDSPMRLGERLKSVRKLLVTLTCGVAVMLVWAGIVEAFISQYHQPVLPYSIKITFGLVELILLVVYLTLSGREGS